MVMSNWLIAVQCARDSHIIYESDCRTMAVFVTVKTSFVTCKTVRGSAFDLWAQAELGFSHDVAHISRP